MSRTLDAWIAEFIMEEDMRKFLPGQGRGNCWFYLIPFYSSQMSAAWLVAAKAGIAVIPCHWKETLQWRACKVSYVAYPFCKPVVEIHSACEGVKHESAAMAICLAAKAAYRQCGDVEGGN